MTTETTDYDSLDLLIPEDELEDAAVLTEHDHKMLDKVAAVAKQVDAIERELDRVARRIENQVAKVYAIRWRNKSKYTRKEILLSTGRLAYDAGMIDENLMRQLFVLDTVLGHEQVRAKRREQVLRIKHMCEVAAKLRQRALRLEKLALSISSAVEWACEKTKQEPEKDKQESETNEKTTERPAQQQSSEQPKENEAQEQQADQAMASQDEEPARQKEDVEMKTEGEAESAPAAGTTPSKKKSKKSRTPQQPKTIPVASGLIHEEEQPNGKREKPAQTGDRQQDRDVPMAAADEPVSTPAPKTAKQQREDPAERTKEKEERISSPDFRTKYGRLPEWNPQFRESQGRDYVELTAHLQGVDKKDLEIDIDGRILIVRGVKKPGQDELFFSHIFGVRDDSYGWFERKFQIPEFLDINNADATFANSVLKIKIPKVEFRRSVPVQQDYYSPFDLPARRPVPSYGYSSRPAYSYRSPLSGFGFW